MNETIEIEPTVKKIRERLIGRFVVAKDMIGERWKDELAKSDPFFNTLEGIRYAVGAINAVSNPSRINDDRLERVVLALEKLAGIQNGPVV